MSVLLMKLFVVYQMGVDIDGYVQPLITDTETVAVEEVSNCNRISLGLLSIVVCRASLA